MPKEKVVEQKFYTPEKLYGFSEQEIADIMEGIRKGETKYLIFGKNDPERGGTRLFTLTAEGLTALIAQKPEIQAMTGGGKQEK